MITSIFSVLINWVLLNSFVALGLSFYGKPLLGWPPPTAAAIISVLGMLILLLLSLTPAAEWLFRVSEGCKECTAEQYAALQPHFGEVCLRAGQDPSQYRLYINPSDNFNAYAIGSGTVAVTAGLLATANAEELKGVLAHELGHLTLGHTLWTRITYTSGQVGRFIIGLYVLVIRICSFFAFIPLLGLFLAVMIWLFVILLKLFQWIVQVPFALGLFFGSRRDEYAADGFAAQLGYGYGLQSFLNRLVAPAEKSLGFFASLHSTHPEAAKRVRRLAEAAT